MNIKKIAIGLAFAIAAAGGSYYAYYSKHTIDLPDLEPLTFGISEDEKDDYPMLYELDQMSKDSFEKMEPSEKMLNTFTSVSGGIIKENLGTDLEERERNYLYARDLLNEMSQNYTVKFDKKYMHTEGYRLGYEIIGEELFLLTSIDGDAIQHRYHLSDNYLRMYAEPEIVYFDMKKEGVSEDTAPDFALYNDNLPIYDEDAYLLADVFLMSIEHEDPVYAITALSEGLEKEITDLSEGKESDYINYDYYIKDGLSKLNEQVKSKYGEDWTDSLDVVFDQDTRIVTIKIGEEVFKEYGVRHNTLINEIELVPTSDFDELRAQLEAVAEEELAKEEAANAAEETVEKTAEIETVNEVENSGN